jgi:hypothetical protein
MLFSLAVSAFCVTATAVAGDECEQLHMWCVRAEDNTISFAGGTPTGRESSAPKFENETVGVGDKTFSSAINLRGLPGLRE